MKKQVQKYLDQMGITPNEFKAYVYVTKDGKQLIELSGILEDFGDGIADQFKSKSLPLVTDGEIKCEHNDDIYKNDYGEKVCVCCKCMRAFF